MALYTVSGEKRPP